eukprot:2167136-Rhodomonas_salina.1
MALERFSASCNAPPLVTICGEYFHEIALGDTEPFWSCPPRLKLPGCNGWARPSAKPFRIDPRALTGLSLSKRIGSSCAVVHRRPWKLGFCP